MNRLSLNKRGSILCQVEKHYIFVALIIPTAVSIALWILVAEKCVLPDDLYEVIVDNRASVGILVLLCSNILAIIQVTVLCKMINYATRVYFKTTPVSLDILRLWDALCSQRLDLTLPKRLVVPLLAFIAFAAVPSALWTGSLTPTPTTVLRTGVIDVPHYRDVSEIYDMNPERYAMNATVLRNKKGAFTYAIGLKMQGGLLNSASSATTVDGSVRLHPKLDTTGYTYLNRSFGVGSSVGLFDDDIISEKHARSYYFFETGYDTQVECEYNRSSQYGLHLNGHDSDTPKPKVLVATGWLPNSNGSYEHAFYFGRNWNKDWTAGTVALGVTNNKKSRERIIGIAAGTWYNHLNQTQCSMHFRPRLFNVSVGLLGRNISVSPVSDSYNIDKTRTLTRLTMRQFSLVSIDQTNIYNSLVGDSLNSSISNFITQHSSNSSRPMSLQQATPGGLKNAFTAMVDDILVAYGSAQSMVGSFTEQTSVTIEVNAFQVGKDKFIFAVFATNVLILMVLVVEAVRTRCWRGLCEFDYIDPAQLVIGGINGASESTKVRSVQGRYVVSLEETGKTGACLVVGAQPTDDQELLGLTRAESSGGQETESIRDDDRSLL